MVTGSCGLASCCSGLRLPPCNKVAKPLLHRYFRLEAQELLGFADIGKTTGHTVDRAGLFVLRFERDTHDAAQHLRELQKAYFLAARDIESFVRDIALRSQQVCPRDVACID